MHANPDERVASEIAEPPDAEAGRGLVLELAGPLKLDPEPRSDGSAALFTRACVFRTRARYQIL
jgi:hypothetical protein